MLKTIKRSFINIRRHSGLTLVSIVMLSSAFLVANLFVLAAWVSNIVIQNLEARAEVTAFFKPDVKEEVILGVKKTLEGSGQVLGVSYVSRDDALKIYQEQHKNEPLLLENITANIFPPSLEIKAKDINDLPAIYEELKGQPQIDDVVFYKDVVTTFQNWVATIRTGGLALISFLGLVSLLMIFLTLGISIHNSAAEIETLKLIGATKSYVQGPFIVQGMIYGLISTIVALLILGIATPFIVPPALAFLKGVTFPNLSYWYIAAAVGLELIAGMLLGALGSLAALGRYLRY